MMRTAINLPDDMAEIIRSFAYVRGISLGEAVAELVREGMQPRLPATTVSSRNLNRRRSRPHHLGADAGR